MTVCFWLAPPAGLEPASICTQSVNALSAQVCLTEQLSVFRFAEAANIANPSVVRYEPIRIKKNQKQTVDDGLLLVGSPCWARTSDIVINSHALYQLS